MNLATSVAIRTQTFMLYAFAVLCVHCAASEPKKTVAPKKEIVAPKMVPFTSTSTLSRKAVNDAVEKGLGMFLAKGWDLEPEFDRNSPTPAQSFRGHRVVSVPPELQNKEAPLRVGDILVRVNTGAIDTEDHAVQAFEASKTRKTIFVEGLRDGKPFTFSIAIVEP